MSYISFKNVSYKYPVGTENVLYDINLELEKGCLYAITGGNGSGKTTLCNVIRGFIPHYYKGDLSGEVSIEGTDIRDWEMGELAKKVGYMFQNPFTQISGIRDTVFEEIAYGLENLGITPTEIQTKVQEVLKLLGIEYLQDKNPNELSGGQKQRIAFASIIVMDPDILVIDEPTSQLDPHGTEEIFKIIKLMKDRGKTIILVEHKMELLAEYSDYVIHLQDGKIALVGETEVILSNERILQYGGSLPQYATLGIEMKKRDMNIDRIPVTEEDAARMISKWMQNKMIHAKCL